MLNPKNTAAKGASKRPVAGRGKAASGTASLMRPGSGSRSSSIRTRYGGWALVVGSAEGMGAAYAERLARDGFDLVLLDIRQADVSEQARRLREAFGIAVRPLACALSRPRAVKAVLDALADDEIGLVIFNAAMAANGPWAEVSLATKLRTVEVNVSAVLMICLLYTSRCV